MKSPLSSGSVGTTRLLTDVGRRTRAAGVLTGSHRGAGRHGWFRRHGRHRCHRRHGCHRCHGRHGRHGRHWCHGRHRRQRCDTAAAFQRDRNDELARWFADWLSSAFARWIAEGFLSPSGRIRRAGSNSNQSNHSIIDRLEKFDN